MLTEDLLVGEEETAVVSGTLEVVVGRAVTAAAAHSGPRVLARVTTLRGGGRERTREQRSKLTDERHQTARPS